MAEAASNEVKQPEFHIQRVYIKDVSFEAPNTPDIFQKEWQADLKLDMDPAMTVKESHDIARQVKKLIFDGFPNVGDVMIHINPHEEEHEDMIRL